MFVRPDRRWLLAAAIGVCLGSVPTAQARLGETLAQLKARFGDVVKVTALQIPVATEYTFKGGRDIAVLACLRGGVCEKITYYRQGRRLTDEEIQQLLTANGQTWIPVTARKAVSSGDHELRAFAWESRGGPQAKRA